MYATLPLLIVSPWIAISDLQRHRIPNHALLVLWLLIETCSVPKVVKEELLVHERALLAFALGCALYWATRGAIGMGDIKLYAILILSLRNWHDSLLALTYACLVGLIWALFIKRARIAFGPPLIIGTMLVLLSA